MPELWICLRVKMLGCFRLPFWLLLRILNDAFVSLSSPTIKLYGLILSLFYRASYYMISKRLVIIFRHLGISLRKIRVIWVVELTDLWLLIHSAAISVVIAWLFSQVIAFNFWWVTSGCSPGTLVTLISNIFQSFYFDSGPTAVVSDCDRTVTPVHVANWQQRVSLLWCMEYRQESQCCWSETRRLRRLCWHILVGEGW